MSSSTNWWDTLRVHAEKALNSVDNASERLSAVAGEAGRRVAQGATDAGRAVADGASTVRAHVADALATDAEGEQGDTSAGYNQRRARRCEAAAAAAVMRLHQPPTGCGDNEVADAESSDMQLLSDPDAVRLRALHDEIVTMLNAATELVPQDNRLRAQLLHAKWQLERPIAVDVVGADGVGKSTLVQALLQAERGEDVREDEPHSLPGMEADQSVGSGAEQQAELNCGSDDALLPARHMTVHHVCELAVATECAIKDEPADREAESTPTSAPVSSPSSVPEDADTILTERVRALEAQLAQFMLELGDSRVVEAANVQMTKHTFEQLFDYYTAPERAELSAYTVRDELHRMSYTVVPPRDFGREAGVGGVAMATVDDNNSDEDVPTLPLRATSIKSEIEALFDAHRADWECIQYQVETEAQADIDVDTVGAYDNEEHGSAGGLGVLTAEAAEDMELEAKAEAEANSQHALTVTLRELLWRCANQSLLAELVLLLQSQLLARFGSLQLTVHNSSTEFVLDLESLRVSCTCAFELSTIAGSCSATTNQANMVLARLDGRVELDAAGAILKQWLSPPRLVPHTTFALREAARALARHEQQEILLECGEYTAQSVAAGQHSVVPSSSGLVRGIDALGYRLEALTGVLDESISQQRQSNSSAGSEHTDDEAGIEGDGDGEEIIGHALPDAAAREKAEAEANERERAAVRAVSERFFAAQARDWKRCHNSSCDNGQDQFDAFILDVLPENAKRDDRTGAVSLVGVGTVAKSRIRQIFDAQTATDGEGAAASWLDRELKSNDEVAIGATTSFAVAAPTASDRASTQPSTEEGHSQTTTDTKLSPTKNSLARYYTVGRIGSEAGCSNDTAVTELCKSTFFELVRAAAADTSSCPSGGGAACLGDGAAVVEHPSAFGTMPCAVRRRLVFRDRGDGDITPPNAVGAVAGGTGMFSGLQIRPPVADDPTHITPIHRVEGEECLCDPYAHVSSLLDVDVDVVLALIDITKVGSHDEADVWCAIDRAKAKLKAQKCRRKWGHRQAFHILWTKCDVLDEYELEDAKRAATALCERHGVPSPSAEFFVSVRDDTALSTAESSGVGTRFVPVSVLRHQWLSTMLCGVMQQRLRVIRRALEAGQNKIAYWRGVRQAESATQRAIGTVLHYALHGAGEIASDKGSCSSSEYVDQTPLADDTTDTANSPRRVEVHSAAVNAAKRFKIAGAIALADRALDTINDGTGDMQQLLDAPGDDSIMTSIELEAVSTEDARNKVREQSLASAVNNAVYYESAHGFGSGFLTGLGGILTLPVAVPAALFASWLLSARLAFQIAAMHGHDVYSPTIATAVLSCVAERKSVRETREQVHGSSTVSWVTASDSHDGGEQPTALDTDTTLDAEAGYGGAPPQEVHNTTSAKDTLEERTVTHSAREAARLEAERAYRDQLARLVQLHKAEGLAGDAADSAARVAAAKMGNTIGWRVFQREVVRGAGEQMAARSVARAWAEAVPVVSGFVCGAVDASLVHAAGAFARDVFRPMGVGESLAMACDSWGFSGDGDGDNASQSSRAAVRSMRLPRALSSDSSSGARLLLLDTNDSSLCELQSEPVPLQLAPKAKVTKEILCPEGSCLHFAFGRPTGATSALKHEISFELHFVSLSGTRRELVPSSHQPLHNWPNAVCGSVVVSERGKALLVFDNSSFWLASKCVQLAFEVTEAPPDVL